MQHHDQIRIMAPIITPIRMDRMEEVVKAMEIVRDTSWRYKEGLDQYKVGNKEVQMMNESIKQEEGVSVVNTEDARSELIEFVDVRDEHRAALVELKDELYRQMKEILQMEHEERALKEQTSQYRDQQKDSSLKYPGLSVYNMMEPVFIALKEVSDDPLAYPKYSSY
eukprot:554796_1